MNANFTQPGKSLLVFRQWSNKGYSLFQVIGRTVKIAFLAIVYLAVAESAEAQKELRKILELGESDVTLEEVEVKGQRISTTVADLARLVTVVTQKEIARSPQSSVQDLLDQVISIDVRQRGPAGVQTDISMNGSTFEQVLVLINGIPFNDPQTGHFNGDVPIPLSAISRIEVLDGGASRWLGPNAFAGAINIITHTSGRKLNGKLEGGQNKLMSGEIMLAQPKSLIGASYLSTAGHRENTDINKWSGVIAHQKQIGRYDIHTQLLGGMKKFGAQDFYTPLYPNQYEEVFSGLASISITKKSQVNWRHDGYWKYHTDEFHLFRSDGPEWYTAPNNHVSQVLGFNNSVWWNNPLGIIALGLDLKHEQVWSTVLGTSQPEEFSKTFPFGGVELNKYAGRQFFNLYAEQSITLDRFKLVGGLMGQYYQGRTADVSVYPGIDLRYSLSQRSYLYASTNRSMRLPSFTELYYVSRTNQGNQDLLPEKAWSSSLGIQHSRTAIRIGAKLFIRFTQNSIDWSKAPEDEKWITRNINELFAAGAQVDAKWKYRGSGPFSGAFAKLAYAYTYVSKADGDIDSRYVLDYLKHKVVLDLGIPLGASVFLGLENRFQDRAGWFTNWDADGAPYQNFYRPVFLTDLQLSYQWRKFRLYATVNNLLNQDYVDIGHVVQPGRWLKFGLAYRVDRDR